MTHGKYTVLRKIADGGMAEIFLARLEGQRGFQKQVVLKRVRAALFADPSFRNMLIDEAHVAMDLNHGNIVQVLDLGESAGRYFLVLELVDGWSLEQLQKRATAAAFPLPPELALYVVAQVCRGLGYAHARLRDGQPMGIVHRDVSPQNILVSEQGEVKLTDFGIAKALTRAENTSEGVVKGKIHFMSPEQAHATPLDGRSDLFSLGAVLYQLVSGALPFAAPTLLESLFKVKAADFLPLDRAHPAVAPELASLVQRSMQRDRDQRYQSAEAMLEDVEKVMRSLRPVGQTELARWLADLAQRDRAAPISRLEPTPTLQPSDVGGTVEIGDSAILPPSLPPTKRPLEERQARRSGAAWLLLLALGAAIAAAVFSLPPGARSPEVAPSGPASDRPAAIREAVDAGDGGGEEDAVADVSDAPSAEEDAGDEAELLKTAVADPEETVIGEEGGPDAGEPSAASPPIDARTAPAKPPAAPTVSVAFQSSPTGAVVKIGRRVFGRTPISLRFRPNILYEVVLVKDGYKQEVRRIFVSEKNAQRKVIALQRQTGARKRR